VTEYGSLFKSTDYGTSWSALDSSLEGARFLALAINPQSPEILYAGIADSGIFRSTDGGTTWNDSNPGPVGYITSLAIDLQNPEILYTGSWSGVHKSVDGGAHWRAQNSGLADYCIKALKVHPQNSSIVYAGSESAIYRSINGGATWNSTGLSNRDIRSLAIDPLNPNNIYAGTYYFGVFKSTNGGSTWNAGNLSNNTILSLAIDPLNPDALYAGTDSSGVYKSIDGGANWSAANSGLTNTSISVLAIHPQNPAILYAGTGGGVFKSTDGGANWSAANNGLSNTSILSLAIDPLNPDALYAGTSEGVYRTANGGVLWSTMSTGMMTAPISALVIDQMRRLYAGTQWKGVWVYPLPLIASSSITINTCPPGLNFAVDGITYSTSQTFSWPPGSSHSISAATPQFSERTRYIFDYWSDGGNVSHSIIIPSEPATYTASFQTQHKLTVSVLPEDSGIISANPASDGYYAAGSFVQLSAEANSGYVFSAWSGDLAGSINPQTITMVAPRNITAIFRLFGSQNLDLNPGGAIAARTSGAGSLHTGYARVTVNSGDTPYSTAVFSFKQGGVTVSEAGVPASPPTTSTLVFIDYCTAVDALPGRSEAGTVDINTGIAVANTGSETANVIYTLRDREGYPLSSGHGTLEAGGYFACFIDQLSDVAAVDFFLPPDFGSSSRFGSLEISSDQPVSLLALRGTNNQRNDFLITTTPVADLTKLRENDPIYFPQFVDGGGYTTSLILMNTSGTTETGIFQIMDRDGNPLVVNPVGGMADSSFNYEIPPNGVFHFQTDGFPDDVLGGWVKLIPDPGTYTPASAGVFGYNPEDVLVSESGIPSAAATTHARVYVDLSENHNTGLAIANVENGNADISIHAFHSDGITEAGISQGPILLPDNGYIAAFADQFVEVLPEDFTGVLDIVSTTPFAALTLRSLLNERHDFLMTTFPVADATRPAPSPIVFPQIADGGGYITEFILISSGQAASTTLLFYDENGTLSDFGE
jgi:photosystem II stability/assembly factor-like uncharacterized protein